MEIVEIRPARIQAGLVAIGDMLVSSPIGPDGARPPRWLGAVTGHVIVSSRPGDDGEPIDVPGSEAGQWRQWQLGLLGGRNVETVPVPADGWVWVHLPIVTD